MRSLFIIILSLASIIFGTFTVTSQELTLTITMPSYIANSLDDDIFADFEADNPGVRVAVRVSEVPSGVQPGLISAGSHLDALEIYAASGDVVYVSSNDLSPVSTASGYFLNLDPLLALQDSTFEAQFYPNMWSAFQWGGSLWALPVAASVNALAYDVDLFAERGLPVPSGDWTAEQFTQLLRDLQDDEVPALNVFDRAQLLRALAGVTLYDPDVLPPEFTDPQTIDALRVWGQLRADGLTDGFRRDAFAPLLLGPINQANSLSNNAQAFSLLPGNIAGLQVDGFAISGGTANPELAFELLTYLSTLPELAQAMNADMSARNDISDGDNGPQPYVNAGLPIDREMLLTEFLPNALSPSELQFGPYLGAFLEQTPVDSISADLLNIVESQIANDLALAEARQDDTIFVMAPTPAPTPEPGLVSLRFGLTFVSTGESDSFDIFVNRAEWNDAADAFVADEPTIDRVDLMFGEWYDILSAPEFEFDCFYLPYHELIYPFAGVVLNLDPLIDSDNAFNEDNIVPTVLDTMRINGSLWSYPLHLYPSAFYYDPIQFNELGIAEPSTDWTINDFEAILSDNDDPSLSLDGANALSYIEMLVTAYGGTFFDYSTNPPTVRFTEAESISALQRVLALLDSGDMYIDNVFENLPLLLVRGEAANVGYNLARLEGYEWLLPPRSDEATPLSYNIGVGYISTDTLYPEACYRWLSMIGQNPTLFAGLPAFESVIDTPEMEATRSREELAFLEVFYDALLADNTVVLPYAVNLGGSQSIEQTTIRIWLSAAMTNVIEDDRDLQTELENAARFINAYYACVSLIPPLTSSDQAEFVAYAEDHTDCIVQADPEFFSPS